VQVRLNMSQQETSFLLLLRGFVIVLFVTRLWYVQIDVIKVYIHVCREKIKIRDFNCRLDRVSPYTELLHGSTCAIRSPGVKRGPQNKN